MNSVSDQEQDARDIRARAAKWVIEGAREDWNEANRAELDAWLGQSPAHMVAYLRAGAAWSRADRLGALRTLAPKEDGHSRPRISGVFGKALAALAILVGNKPGALSVSAHQLSDCPLKEYKHNPETRWRGLYASATRSYQARWQGMDC